MGTGKSTVGKELARQQNSHFIDLDELIEQRQDRSINEIFSEHGEPYFRKLEKELLREISSKTDQVVSCGGGIVLDPDNIKLIKETGFMVCLTSPAEVILERTRIHTHRPLLNVTDPLSRIAQLLKQRQPLYAQAELTIDTSSCSIPQAVAEILSRLPRP